MSWHTLDPAVRQIAEQVLTAKQLLAYRLHANGMTEREIAIHCQVSRRAIRDRLAEADVKINAHPDYPKEHAA
jgi:DNA-binding CsgD family transcriptional regulator